LVTIFIFPQKSIEHFPCDFLSLPVHFTKPDQNSKVSAELVDAEIGSHQASGEFTPLHFRHLIKVFKLAV